MGGAEGATAGVCSEYALSITSRGRTGTCCTGVGGGKLK